MLILLFFGIARRIEPSVTAFQWTGEKIEADEFLQRVEPIKNNLNEIRGFECERFGIGAFFMKAYDCMLDGSDKRAAEEAWKCFQKISEEYPESHIKFTAHRGGSKIEFLM